MPVISYFGINTLLPLFSHSASSSGLVIIGAQ